MLELSGPKIIERESYQIVGAYCTFEGEDEGPGWSGASAASLRIGTDITGTTWGRKMAEGGGKDMRSNISFVTAAK